MQRLMSFVSEGWIFCNGFPVSCECVHGSRDEVWYVGNGRICGRAGIKDWQLRCLDRIENVGFILVWHTAFGTTPVLSKAGGQCGCFGMEQVFCELRCMDLNTVFWFWAEVVRCGNEV